MLGAVGRMRLLGSASVLLEQGLPRWKHTLDLLIPAGEAADRQETHRTLFLCLKPGPATNRNQRVAHLLYRHAY